MKFTKKPLNTFNKLSKKSTKFFKRNLRKIFKGGGEDIKTALEIFAGKLDKHNTAQFYKAMRDELLAKGGLNKIKEWLSKDIHLQFLKNTNESLINNNKLKNDDVANVFVVKAFQKNYSPNGINMFEWSSTETEHNKKYITNKNFVISFNKPELDNDWEYNKTGKGSMSARHRLLIIKDDTIRHFNVLTFGMDDDGINNELLQQDIDLLKQMKDAALLYVDKVRINGLDGPDGETWSNNIGLFFHCFPFNSVQSLHLHIVDLNKKGPAFYKYENQNLPIDEVIKVLENELKHLHAVSIYGKTKKVNERGFETDKWGGKKHTRKLHKIKRRKNNTRRRRRH